MSQLNRRCLLFAATGVAVWPPLAIAQVLRKPVLAVLTQRSLADFKPYGSVLIEQMKALGWREGENIDYVFRAVDGRPAEAVASELVAQKPDLILASTPTVALAVKKYTNSIPIVFSFVFDPVALGLVKSLSKPGGNVTGTTTRLEGLWGKRLQLLRETLLGLRTVAVIYDPTDAEDSTTVVNLQGAAIELGVQVTPFGARRAEDLEGIFLALKERKIDAAITGGSALLAVHRIKIADAAIASRVPVFGVTEDRVEAGMLISYGINLLTQYKIAARYADRILRGVRPSDLPVEQPTVLRLCINLRTAAALGITIPRAILLRADRVIE